MFGFFRHYITVLKYAFKKKATLRYPTERNSRSDRFRGVHTLQKELCVQCKTCEASCVNGCISVDKNFEIDYRKCCLCGRCVAACPTKALVMTNSDVKCELNQASLIHHLGSEK